MNDQDSVKYEIAGHIISLKSVSDDSRSMFGAYRYKGDQPAEKHFEITKEAFDEESRIWVEQYHDEIEHMLLSKLFYEWLLTKGGMFLHSSALALDGEAYMFSADPGTGKSTHLKLWQQHFGFDKITVINDDKPFVLLKDGRFYACGSPWCGKELTQTNIQIPLKAVCFLEQSKQNEIERLRPKDAVMPLLAQTYLPADEKKQELAIGLADKLLNAVPFFRLRCNISDEAVRVAYQAMRQA